MAAKSWFGSARACALLLLELGVLVPGVGHEAPTELMGPARPSSLNRSGEVPARTADRTRASSARGRAAVAEPMEYLMTSTSWSPVAWSAAYMSSAWASPR